MYAIVPHHARGRAAPLVQGALEIRKAGVMPAGLGMAQQKQPLHRDRFLIAARSRRII